MQIHDLRRKGPSEVTHEALPNGEMKRSTTRATHLKMTMFTPIAEAAFSLTSRGPIPSPDEPLAIQDEGRDPLRLKARQLLRGLTKGG